MYNLLFNRSRMNGEEGGGGGGGGRSSSVLLSAKVCINIKSVHFGHVHSQLFAPVNTHVHGKVLSLSYHVIVIFEQLIIFFKVSFFC